MKVLYISDRRMGGIVNHVKCLTECLPPEVERYVIGEGGDEPFAGKNGHDWREWFQIRRVIRRFRPDVIHFNTIPLFMALYVKMRRLFDLRLGDWGIGRRGKSDNQTIKQSNNQKVAVVCAIHTPSGAKKVAWDRAVLNWAIEPCYWLPVSDANWRNFKRRYPKARGEVFYNPLRIDKVKVRGEGERRREGPFVVGMVGRNAEQKDWPSFHKVEEIVKGKVSRFQSFKVEEFKVVKGAAAPFCRTADAIRWARSHGLIGRMEEIETGGKGVVTISAESIREALNPRQREKSVSQVLHFAALMKLRELIRESRILESHSDWRKDAAGIRTPLAGVNNEVEICVAYAAFGIGEGIYRVRLTLKRYAQTGTSKAYAYRVNEIEVAPGTLGGKIALTTSPTGTTSICGAILLNGVYDVNGVPEFLNAGEKEVCDGREAIRKMDLFVMTSKHEQLPTTVLECFMIGTPICGFLPEGGTSDILQYSKGPVREVFIKERSCEKLAEIVLDLMAHPEKRRALVEDGRQILEGHFDAEKNVRGRLMEIYRRESRSRCEVEVDDGCWRL